MKLKLFMLMMLIFLGGCSQTKPYDHKFQYGDFVKAKLDGRIGMVIWLPKHHNQLTIRFSQNSSINLACNASLLGGLANNNSIYVKVRMYDWELEEYNEEALPCPR